MNLHRLATLILLTAVPAALYVAPASAGFIEKRYGNGFVVTPQMMSAINTIVAEKMKMAHRRHR